MEPVYELLCFFLTFFLSSLKIDSLKCSVHYNLENLMYLLQNIFKNVRDILPLFNDKLFKAKKAEKKFFIFLLQIKKERKLQ